MKLERILSIVELNSSSPIRCVVHQILRHLTDPSEMVEPNARLVEDEARRLWTTENRCSCGWQRAKQTAGSQVGRKRVTRRYDAATHDWSNTTISTPSTDDDKSPVEIDNWTAQRSLSHWSSSSSLSSSSSDDDDDKYFVSKKRCR